MEGDRQHEGGRLERIGRVVIGGEVGMNKVDGGRGGAAVGGDEGGESVIRVAAVGVVVVDCRAWGKEGEKEKEVERKEHQWMKCRERGVVLLRL